MKPSAFCVLSLGALLSPAAFGLSLYDTAPAIGLPESFAVRYSASVSVGYDDNLDSERNSRKGGAFTRFGVGAAYADYESVTRLAYNARLGGTFYSKEANGTRQQMFSDISIRATLQHSLDYRSMYKADFSLSYTPEPDYANGISAPLNQGDCLNWSVANTYSRFIDERWSWNVNASYSGNIYSESEYQIDDRQYVNAGAGLNYRVSVRTTYGIGASYRYEMRDHGFDSRSGFINASVSHSLSAISSATFAVGAQAKFIDGDTNFYPNMRAGYARTLAEGLTTSVYVSLDNENVNTYNYRGNYRSDMTWRAGADFNYRFTPTVSFVWGASLLDSSYSKGTNNLSKTDRTTWTGHVGMTYAFTSELSGNIHYKYTHSTGSNNYGYHRNVMSAGLSYTF